MSASLVQIAPITTEDRASSFVPVRLLEIEISQPIPAVLTLDEKTGRNYRRANCLVRLHSQPLGIVEFCIDECGMTASECAQAIWDALQDEINMHLQMDNCPIVFGLQAEGLITVGVPHCIEQRNEFLTHAPFVSVIVSTRDRPEQIERCLQSLTSLHYTHYEIVVVDNAPSSDATAKLIQQATASDARIRYVLEERPGLAWARNRGINIAKGEILAFTDDDVIVDSYWLLEMVRAFSYANDVVCVTGLILPLELETQAQFWFEEYGGFSKGFTPQLFDMKKHHPRTPLHPYTAGKFGTGASMAFTKSFLESIGRFDTLLGVGSPTKSGEDFAALFRAVMKGHTLVYQPASLLYHLHRRDYAGLSKQIYSNAVGLVAYLIRIVLEMPWLLFDIASKLPYGFFFAFNTKSPKNRKKSTSYPDELTKIELKGMLYGPVAFLQSVWKLRSIRKKYGSLK